MNTTSIYTTLNGESFALSDLESDERQLISDLIIRQRAASSWSAFANDYMRQLGEFYKSRGISRKSIIELPLWKIASDLKSRMMVRAGDALPPDYRDSLGTIIRSDYPTQKAFCDATGLTEDLVSHVLARRKHLAIDTLSEALRRIGYRLAIVPIEKV